MALVACSDVNAAGPAPASDVDAGGASADASDDRGMTGQQDYTLSMVPIPRLSLLPGQTATVKLTVARGATQQADIRLSLSGLPSEFAPPADVIIPGGSSTGTLSIVVPATPTPGAVTARVTATAVTTDPNAAASTTVSLKAVVHGKAGDPDTTFGTNGTTDVVAGGGSFILQLLSAPDGSIYTLRATVPPSPGAAVSHLLPDGKLDTNYGSAGEGKIAVTLTHRAAVQKDGKVVIVGGGGGAGGTIGRLDAKGKPEAGFTSEDLGPGAGSVGTGGLGGTNGGNGFVAVRDSDGAIFVTFGDLDGNVGWIGQLRFDRTGVLHTAYGTGGGVRHLSGANTGLLVRNNPASHSLGAVALTVIVDPNTLGFTQQTGDDGVDPAAGAQPKTASVPFNVIGAGGLVELSDDSVVTLINEVDKFYLRKLDPVGNAPATTFGTAGLAGPFGESMERAINIKAQPDGKLLILMRTGRVLRFNGDGTADTGFGSGGSISISSNTSYPPIALAADADRILVGYLNAGGTAGTVASFWQ